MAVYSVRGAGPTGAGVALSAATTKTLIGVTPGTDFFLVAQLSISMDASAAAAGVSFEMYRASTTGTATTTTPVKANRGSDAGAATSTARITFTVEPTLVEIIDDWYLQPFGGIMVLQYPLGREPISVASGNGICLRYITPAAVTPNCRATVWFDER